MYIFIGKNILKYCAPKYTKILENSTVRQQPDEKMFQRP